MSFLRHWFTQPKEHENETFSIPDGTTGLLVASPNSARLAYIVEERRGTHVEVNGRRLRTYEDAKGITFSPDSRTLAYRAFRRQKAYVVWDENEYGPYETVGITSPIISPDSKHIAFTAMQSGKWFAILDGNIIYGPCEGFAPGGIVFSPDSQKVAFAIKRRDSWLAVVNAEEQDPYPTILERSWGFSPDSKKFAYVAAIEGIRIGHRWVGKEALIIDGKHGDLWTNDETTRHGPDNEIYFSPDSKITVYSVFQAEGFFFVINDIPQTKYTGIASGWRGDLVKYLPDYGKASWKSGCITFSPDSQHFCYAVVANNLNSFIYDGEVKGEHKSIFSKPIVFSPNSKRFAYSAEEEDSKQFLVVDGQPLKSHDGLTPAECSFSPDSQHIAYIAATPGTYYLVIDAQSCRLKGGPVIGAKLVWDDSQRLHTLIADGREVIVARYEVGPDGSVHEG